MPLRVRRHTPLTTPGRLYDSPETKKPQVLDGGVAFLLSLGRSNPPQSLWKFSRLLLQVSCCVCSPTATPRVLREFRDSYLPRSLCTIRDVSPGQHACRVLPTHQYPPRYGLRALTPFPDCGSDCRSHVTFILPYLPATPAISCLFVMLLLFFLPTMKIIVFLF